MEHNIKKHKELLETKKRINEFKLKQMKAMNERVAEGDDDREQADDIDRHYNEYDPRDNDPMIKTSHGMQVRFQPR